MKFSIFDDDHTLGLSVRDFREVKDPGGTPCNCLHGTPVIDANGNCTCVDTLPVNSPPFNPGPPRGQWGQNGAGGIWAYMPFSNTTIRPDDPRPQTTAGDGGFFSGTIFGLPVGLVLLGGGAVALWVISSMDGKK